MECERCGEDGLLVEMELIDVVEDYYDPNNFWGHGQYEGKEYQCPKCKYTEPYIREQQEGYVDDDR